MPSTTFNGMTREQIIKDWVEALESGEYRQGRRLLASKTDSNSGELNAKTCKFCCLGLLCMVAKIKPDLTDNHAIRFGRNTGLLPPDIATFLNISQGGTLTQRSYASTLAEMNDGGESFEQIACAIRNGLVAGLEDAPKILGRRP